jgi:predicted nucleic acid-binding protein
MLIHPASKAPSYASDKTGIVERRVHHPDKSTTFVYAELYRQLRSQGTPIPTNDLWIASLTVQHDWILCSQDAHFKSLPQIPVL